MLQDIHSKIGEVLEKITIKNSMLSFTLKSLGVSSNPTVSEWIKQKQGEKKANIQSNLIFWDIHKFKKEETIKLKQVLTSERAIQHAAWDSEKNIQQRIKSIKEKRIDKIENLNICYIPMHSINTGMYHDSLIALLLISSILQVTLITILEELPLQMNPRKISLA